MGLLTKAILVLAGGYAAKEVFGGLAGAPTAAPGTFQKLPTADTDPPGTSTYVLTAEHDVGPIGGTFDVPLVGIGKGSDIVEVRADVAATVYIEPHNQYYGTAGKQCCRGVRLNVRAERTQTGVALNDPTEAGNDAACLAVVTPETAALQISWPPEASPTLALAMVGDKLTLRVGARKLLYGDVQVANKTPPDAGHDPAWWAKHTGPYRYTLRVRVALRLVPI